MLNLNGRSIFITGSSQGVGREIALAAVRAGADVVLHGLNDDKAAEAMRRDCRAAGRECPILFGDLSGPMPEAVEAIAVRAVEQNPRIDTLVCNAGIYVDQPFLEMDFATFDRTMKVNVYAQYLLVQFFARRWVQQKTQGRILLIGSINGRLSEPTHVAYDTSKGAVEAMVRSLCVTLAPLQIRVNGMAPGLFRTPLTAPALNDPRLNRWMELHTPNGQVPGPEVCGETAVFLLSDAASHIHGQMLLVDGGMSAWQQPDPPDEWMPAATET
ncbi:MAG: SDR family oxidoreductase [Planctomycetaceae bacterium]|nr:SDR family oxidoreductase [Planctomycetaceae bacterium]